MASMQGKVALVTGGGTGLGREISNLLVAKGVDIALTYSRSRDEAEKAARELAESGRRVTSHQVDVSVSSDVEGLIEQVQREHGGIDLLVNCAGTTVFAPFDDLSKMTDEVWDLLLGVNVKGPFNCTRAVVDSMRSRGGGSVINITSTSALRPTGSSVAYAVSKAAETHLTRCLAAALAPAIRVNAIAPGGMWTRWWEGRLTSEKQQELASTAPLKRWADVGDVAEMAVAVLANESMTGQTVILDGGVVMP
jgi:3-oxoacyl-[acyl-carrier protein] reductase